MRKQFSGRVECLLVFDLIFLFIYYYFFFYFKQRVKSCKAIFFFCCYCNLSFDVITFV